MTHIKSRQWFHLAAILLYEAVTAIVKPLYRLIGPPVVKIADFVKFASLVV